jgi:hypothetical protein
MNKKIQFRNIIFLGLLFIAWACFEVVNYTTTELAIFDIVGEVGAVLFGFKWSTVGAVAFCLVDFAGIARAFTPQEWSDEPQEVVFLTGAWLLAASLNALMTWWAVSMSIEANAQPHTFVDMADVLKWAPILMALAMLVLRVTIIGTVSMELEKFLHPELREKSSPTPTRVKRSSPKRKTRTTTPKLRRTAPKTPRTVTPRATLKRPEPPSSLEDWSIDQIFNPDD